jgi:hypothetical protein
MTNLAFDDDTRLMVSIFQKVFHLSRVERDQVKYVKRYAGAIKSTGQLFEYLGLARPDKQSPLGWRPTLVLLDIMNKHARGKSKPSDQPISMLDHLLMSLLHDAIFGAGTRMYRTCPLGYEVLHELGLVRRDDEDQSAPTPRLLRLFQDAYFKHRAESKRSTKGSFDRDSIIRDDGRLWACAR